MPILTGTVVDGRVEVQGVLLEEGTVVTVLVPDEVGQELTPDMVAELEESIAQADRGEGIPAEHVLDRLDQIVRSTTSR